MTILEVYRCTGVQVSLERYTPPMIQNNKADEHATLLQGVYAYKEATCTPVHLYTR